MKIQFIYAILISVFVLSFLSYITFGSYTISIREVIEIFAYKMGIVYSTDISLSKQFIVFESRLPRSLVAILVGSSISVSGAAMQGLFRNPLADPGLIGISSGASLAAAVLIVFGVSITSSSSLFGMYFLSFFTFLGACIAAFLVFRFSTKQGRTIISMMLLSGIAIAAFAESVRGIASYYADEAQLKDLTFWLLGSLSGANWKEVLMLLPFTFIPILVLPRMHKDLNSLSLGESNASLLGVNTNGLKRKIIVLVTLAVGASVAAIGVISFIGLVVPHIIRLVAGPDNKHVLLLCILLGGIILLVADLICRTLVSPSELPLGVVTSLIGAPIFLSILINQRKKSTLS